MRGVERSSPDRHLGRCSRAVRELVRVGRRWRHRLALRSKLSVGHNVTFGPRARLRVPDFAKFGSNVSVGADFYAEANLDIGDDVLISTRVAFIGNDHRLEGADESIYWAGRLPASTAVLEGDNLVGFGATLIGSVRLGHGCIVGARSVVTGDLPPNTICVGVPARVVRQRHRGGDLRSRDVGDQLTGASS